MDLSQLADKFLTQRDRDIYLQAGYGGQMGWGKKPALLVIDVSWGFCGDKPQAIGESIKTWPNSCGQESWNAIRHIEAVLEKCRELELPVIYTTGEWRDDKWDMGSWLWKHTRSRPEDPSSKKVALDPDEIVTPLRPHKEDILIFKKKPSAFFGTPLQSYLNLLGVDSLIVTGCTTSGCVRATVVDAFSSNYRVAVVADACFDRSETSHAVSLIDMHAKYADVVSSEETLSHLSTSVLDRDRKLFPGKSNLRKGRDHL